MRAWLSADQQIERMRAAAPYMRLTAQSGRLAFWSGPLRPLRRTYMVTIGYVARWRLGDLEIKDAYEPVVRLAAPRLILCHPRTGEDVPHVYWDARAPELSALCLYDPAADEWSPADFIADTIVPWTCDWIVCYEGWLASGIWSGGGRHPGRRRRAICPMTEPFDEQSRDRRERALRAAFVKLGQKIGTFASLPLMAAASVGSTRPLSSRDWRNASLAAPPWRTTST
jgi:hypothetical protein